MTDSFTDMFEALKCIQAAHANIPLGTVMAAQQDPHLRTLLTTVGEAVPPAVAAARETIERNEDALLEMGRSPPQDDVLIPAAVYDMAVSFIAAMDGRLLACVRGQASEKDCEAVQYWDDRAPLLLQRLQTFVEPANNRHMYPRTMYVHRIDTMLVR